MRKIKLPYILSYFDEKTVTESRYEQYEAFVKSHPKGHFAQSLMWAKLKTDWGYSVVLAEDEQGEICGSMLLLVRKIPFLNTTIIYSPRGPVCDVHCFELLKTLLDGAMHIAKKRRGCVIKMDTDIKKDDQEFNSSTAMLGYGLYDKGKGFGAIQPRFVFRLDLRGKDIDKLMEGFSQKTRYNIRLAVRKGVTVKVVSADMVDEFYKIMLETGIRDNFVIRSAAYFKRLLNCMGDNARLYMAYLDGKPIAGSLAIAYGDKVWYLYGASSNSYRNVMPNYLLQFEMIKWAVELGADIYDFRGVSGDISPDNPLYGLYRFKKGFGGELVEFLGELNYICRPKTMYIYNLLEKLYKRYNKLKFKLQNKKS